MLTADAFTALGFVARRDFIDPETCRLLREAVRRAPASPLTVADERGDVEIDRSTRSTDLAKVAPEAVELVERRLAAVIPEIARHYGLPIRGFQPPQFLVYHTGDFFHEHTDNAEGDDASEYLRARSVAAVIFLNGEGDPAESDAFRGGELTFYDLFEQLEAERLGFPLQAEEGLLIAFPAGVTHEVRPVEAGERYTVVTWFEEERADEPSPVQAHQ